MRDWFVLKKFSGEFSGLVDKGDLGEQGDDIREVPSTQVDWMKSYFQKTDVYGPGLGNNLFKKVKWMTEGV